MQHIKKKIKCFLQKGKITRSACLLFILLKIILMTSQKYQKDKIFDVMKISKAKKVSHIQNVISKYNVYFFK